MQAQRQGSEASEIFSLDLSHNLAGLARMQSGLLGAESAGVEEAADLQRLLRLLRPQTDFEVQVCARCLTQAPSPWAAQAGEVAAAAGGLPF
jgi:hypothetical protein